MPTIEDRLTSSADAIGKAAISLEQGLSYLHEAVGIVSDDENELAPVMLRYRAYARDIEAVLQRMVDDDD